MMFPHKKYESAAAHEEASDSSISVISSLNLSSREPECVQLRLHRTRLFKSYLHEAPSAAPPPPLSVPGWEHVWKRNLGNRSWCHRAVLPPALLLLCWGHGAVTVTLPLWFSMRNVKLVKRRKHSSII